MNHILLEEIIKHIYASLAIIPGDFIDLDKTKSLRSKEFLLNEHISFDVDDKIIDNNVWACQISADNNELKMILADCSQDKDISEFALVVQLKNAPAYGLYLIYNSEVNSEALLACTINNSDWLECNTYLQATFLAAMERLKDTYLNWNKCTNYKDHFNLLQSFIKYHDSVFEE
jgi:hypothetical protein